MKKIKILIPILAGILIMGLINSCEPDNLEYDGPSVVEFFPVSKSVDNGSGETGELIKVQLVGPQESAPITINFVVDAASTAVAGTNYTLVTDGSFVIPANSSFGYINVDVLNDAAIAADVKLILTLTGNADISPSENYKTFTLTIRD